MRKLLQVSPSLRLAAILLLIAAGLLGCAKSAQDLYKDGLMELENGNITIAQERFEAAVEKDPSLIAAHRHLVKIYSYQKETEKLIVTLQKLVEQQPFNTEVSLQLASQYLQQGQFDQGLKIYENLAASAVNEKEKQAFQYQIQALKSAKDRQERIQVLTKQLSSDPNNPIINMDLGDLYFKMGQNLSLAGKTSLGDDFLEKSMNLLDNAQKRLEERLAEKPEASDAKIALASVYFEIGQHYLFNRKADEAIEFFQKALQYHPSVAKYYFVLSQLHFTQKQYPEAIQAVQKAIELEPDSVLYYENLARYCAANKDFEGCIAALEEANNLSPESGKYLFQMAVLYDQQKKGDKDTLIKLLKQAVSREPDEAQYRFSLAGFLGQEKQYEESLAELKQIINRNPGGPWAERSRQMIERTEKEMAQQSKE